MLGGDAHPDAPPRRPIFAAHDLGTPFDEIVTDRAPARGAAPPVAAAPKAESPAPPKEQAPSAIEEEALVFGDFDDLPSEPAGPAPEPVTPEAVADAPVAPEAVAEEPAAERAPAPEPAPAPSPAVAEAAGPAAEEPEPVASSARADDSIATLMARFEGGLDRLAPGAAPNEPAPLTTLKRTERNPDDALREALEALQRMAARQR